MWYTAPVAGYIQPGICDILFRPEDLLVDLSSSLEVGLTIARDVISQETFTAVAMYLGTQPKHVMVR